MAKLSAKGIEDTIINEFKCQTLSLRTLPASAAMQEELVRLATPFHEKLKEIGYTADESRLLLKKAFAHSPISYKWVPQMPLNVFN